MTPASVKFRVTFATCSTVVRDRQTLDCLERSRRRDEGREREWRRTERERGDGEGAVAAQALAHELQAAFSDEVKDRRRE